MYEVKLDGYRALAINVDGKLSLYSRNRKSFHRQYQHIFDALRDLPLNTVIDGEIVALDDAGRPNFNFLQHSRSQAKPVSYRREMVPTVTPAANEDKRRGDIKPGKCDPHRN